jgi:SAM-dependent methyltransferase
MNFEQKVYEIDEIWHDGWLSDEDQNRIDTLTNNIDSLEVKSLLDVGCGNGLFLNFLAENRKHKYTRLCGAERSESALKHVLTEKYQASIDNLPFKDNEFDIVCCLEVIEHLPIEVYQKAIQELYRVAKKYVLISVPYNENLELSLSKCPVCRTEFNPEYHMRSFDKAKISNIFSGFSNIQLLKVDCIDITIMMGAKKIFPRIFRLLGHRFPNHTICPMCGYDENYKLKKSKDSIENEPSMLKNVVKKIWPKVKSPRWGYGIFEKKS